MKNIDTENSNNFTEIENDKINTQYQKDKNNIEDFLNHKSPTFNLASFKRLMLTELSYKDVFKYRRICGFTRQQIERIIQTPWIYGNHILRLSRYMMEKSGYYRRLIDYFVNMAVINWTIDTEIKSDKMYAVKNNIIMRNYIKYSAHVNKFKIDSRITDIMERLFVEDACFGFVSESDIDTSIFFIDPELCEIKKLINGCVYEFAINKSIISSEYFEILPPELKNLIIYSDKISKNNMVLIPYQNSICIKYNNSFQYLYPPFFSIISEILNIDDVKDLSKAKSEADAYKLVYFKIPLDNDGHISIGDELVSSFVEAARQILPERFGVIPAPMDMHLIESKSTVSDDTNKVSQAVENYYGEAGVSKALISSASSGSELKLSMKVDSSSIYRIYRQIESWMDLQMKMRGYIYDSYQFVYHIIPTTIFDVQDYIDTQLKLAQASLPNKGLLAAANGINTAKMLGNTFMENIILNDVFESWMPLKSSYTQSGDAGNEGGRPVNEDTDLAPSTEIQRGNDSNNVDNRI